MSAMIPPGRWDDDPHRDVELLHEALQGHELAPSHEDALATIAGCGHEHTMAVIALLDMAATGPAPTHGDPHLAEGLPSYMSVGVSQGPPAEPWWHCARCAHTMRNLDSVEHARVWASEHARTRHGGAA